MRVRGWIWAVSLTAATFGCTRYEYEEDVFLGVDGSGSLRVSGSTEVLARLHGLPAGDTAKAREYFDREGLEVSSVRRTSRDGRDYVHVQSEFERFDALCDHPAFAARACALERVDDELRLRVHFALEGEHAPQGVPGDARLALRFHFPSAVRFHNAERGVERGNILRWERTATEAFSGEPFDVKADFEPRSILKTTALVLGSALSLVLVSAAIAIFWMYRKGRRQLAEGVRTTPAEPGRP